MNRFFVAVVCAFALALSVSAASLSKSVPKGWGEDFAKACEEAKNEGKLLLLAFSGSDWCSWCMKMEREIYSDRKFVSKAKRRFVLVMIDSPQNKSILSSLAAKQNPGLVEKFGISGYPTTIIARPSGEVVKRFGGYQKGGVEPFLKKLDGVAAEILGSAGASEEDAGKDDRFFTDPADKAKVAAREAKRQKDNAADDFELDEFAGIKIGATKADGAPKLAKPFRLLSAVSKTSYTGTKLTGFTLAAPAEEIKQMDDAALRLETCKLVRALEDELGVKFAVTSSKIEFNGKKTAITVRSARATGQLEVQFLKKR